MAFQTSSKQWGTMVNKSFQASLGWLKQTNNDLGVPVNVGAAAVQTIDTAVAAVVDGTMLSNSTTIGSVDLTVANLAAQFSVAPHQRESNLVEPANLAKIRENHAGRLMKGFQDLVISAIAAGTPVLVETLPVGQVNFTTDGTDSEIAINLRLIASVVAQCIANHGNLDADDFAIVLDRRAFGNFVALRPVTGLTAPVRSDGVKWTFMGIPMFSIASSTYGLGEVSQYCAFVTNKENLAFAWDEPYIHGGGLVPYDDGSHKLVTIMTAAYGVIEDDFMGAILNSGS